MAGRDNLPLDIPGEQEVLRLQRRGPDEASKLGEADDLLDLASGVDGQSDVADRARADGVVEKAQRLIERGVRIEGVHLVQVDRVDCESPQRGVEGITQVTA